MSTETKALVRAACIAIVLFGLTVTTGYFALMPYAAQVINTPISPHNLAELLLREFVLILATVMVVYLACLVPAIVFDILGIRK